MRLILYSLITVSVFFTSLASAQILTFDFASLAGNEASANSNYNDPNIGISTITRGAGLTASNNGGRFNATNWATTSIANAVAGNDYMEFTISPTSGCSFSITAIDINLQRSSTGGRGIAIRSSADGFTTNLDTEYAIADVTTTQSFTFTFSQTGISTSTVYRIYMWAEAGTGSCGPGDFSGNDIVVYGSTSCSGSGNTVSNSNLSSTTYSVDCNTGTSGTIDISSTGTFNSGNNYMIQLSDASGSFTSPTNIGTIASTSNTENGVLFTIPAGTASGSGYRIRIVSTNPAVTSSDNGSNITITLTGGPCVMLPPYITSILYDGCNTSPCSNEGTSEILFGNTGGYSLTVNSSNIDLNYLTGTPYNLTGSIVNNSATTSVINASSGCVTPVFYDAFGLTLPPNTDFLLVSENLCDGVFDWSGLCGLGPIYVIYGSAGTSGDTWHDGGNFGNSGGVKNYEVYFNTSGGSFTTAYNYTAPSSGTNGNYAAYSTSGGSPTSQGTFANCSITPEALPVELIDFKGQIIDSKNELFWATASERNASHFEVEVSNDGESWELVGSIAASGNSTETNSYSVTHYQPNREINYYRLSHYDLDGAHVTYSKLVSLDNGDDNSELIGIYNTLGQKISGTEKGVQIHVYSDGTTKRIFKN